MQHPKATLPAFQPFIQEERALVFTSFSRGIKLGSARAYATYSADLGDRLRGHSKSKIETSVAVGGIRKTMGDLTYGS
jgi:hypothetical protein